MSHIDAAFIERLSKLSRISLKADEIRRLEENLEKILKHIDQLQQVDTTGVEPCFSVQQSLTCPLFEDEPEPLMTRSELMENAPDKISGFIRVPTVIKGA
ncbi:MAG: Asp-tRNA(Asn)/Glu-tRNA(Gln) amidotransferase subunit GatC [Verrucomicrobia bacterium]|nr:Asp-tRNA(Asn)/Glu-tRNA(Gln) amidotransferase subunit GatC [Verrucomicrobiota bacterium]NDE63217.1 Asp-tRNA(Asn)/Glu-tRNA(Gln) amidotransferase GatCAB subunit C [Chlamydiota bacterium]